MFVGIDANILSYQPEKRAKRESLWQSQSFVKAGGALVVCVPRLCDPWSLGGGL
jgi:hypothetical protein